MTQLLLQCFSQSIGRCARLNRWLSYCRGAHWLVYFFLKFPGPHISEKLEIFLMRPVQNAGDPDEQICNDISGLSALESRFAGTKVRQLDGLVRGELGP